jgi:outer membrane receptor protein involved in Fe transport
MLAQLVVPSVQMGHEIDSATAFIRGIGPIRTETARKARSPCISMRFTRTGDAFIFTLNAISGLDVLEGPQGTLLGLDATGAVITWSAAKLAL